MKQFLVVFQHGKTRNHLIQNTWIEVSFFHHISKSGAVESPPIPYTLEEKSLCIYQAVLKKEGITNPDITILSLTDITN